ncbi:WD40 repeat domain-containing protein [Sporobolomyces salmoneus]|uniref:WD40 repeat domain-containing protein n=1 Tax=Sporobolomyces salmoneus TaxID=183962 RepID=UPI003170F993
MSSIKRPSEQPTKRTRKNKKARKNAGETPEPVILGSTSTRSLAQQKNEEELELEEAVFGHRTEGTETLWDLAEEDLGKGKGKMREEFSEGEEDAELEETGLERLKDDNLFFFDAPLPVEGSKELSPSPDEVSLIGGDESDEDSDSESEESDSDALQKSVLKSRNIRQAAWYDPADEELQISLQGQKRLRKLRDAAAEDVVSGLEYENRLRRQFEKLHPTPQWALDARRKILRKRAGQVQRGGNAALLVDSDVSDADTNSEDRDSADEKDEADDLFRKATIGGQGKRIKGGRLEPGEIDIDRVRDANQHDPKSAPIVEIGFHPRAQVLFSTTSDRRLRLFQIDGTDNPLLQSLHLPELPISSAAFHPSGSSILLTGNRPFFLSYDLQTGQTLRSPRGLLNAGIGGSDKSSTGGAGGMEQFRFSPGAGEMLAVGGRRGYVHLVDWSASGVSRGGQVIGEVKMNDAVKGIAWQREGKELLTLGENSEVYVWDVGTRKCVDRWRDDGGFGGNGLETSRNGEWTAIGSSTGIVNLYDSSSNGTYSQGAERKARKAVGNLTTSVTTMRFNHDAQLLALASKTNKDQLKLVHLPTCSVFSNWPTQQTPLHHVTCIDFSKRSEWLAVGNQRGKVLLYEVKQFARGSKVRSRR